MKISYNWLQEFIDLELSPEETADKLTLIGLEVEELEEYGSLLEGVIVGEVLEVRPHPNADRLQICDVNLGDAQTQIVCGAKNVAAGQKVPVATVGATLPVKLDNGDFLTIRKAKLRGEVSEGMICAEDELGLGTDHDGIMVLDENLEAGTPVSEVFDLYTDTIIDIAITPNRPDATCHLGVARDLAAALDLELVKPQIKTGDLTEESDDISISISAPEKCHRYVGKMVRGVEIADSPDWLKNRLKAIGVRPVNNVVDVTNYVMFEMGQPLHAFDYKTIAGKKIEVKTFSEEITFETLDHQKRSCSPGTLFICDAGGPVAIAGVMGGVDSEVSDDTTDILIESAYFDPGSIRKTAKEQMLQTDASYRFERGIDPEIQAAAAARAAELIQEVAGGTISEQTVDIHPVKTEKNELTLRKSYVNRLLGTKFSVQEILNLLDGLELEVLESNDDTATFSIPTFRPDLQREVDLIEEVGRLYDYNNIDAPTHGIFVSSEPLTDWEVLNNRIREVAQQAGFQEIYSNSLISETEAGHYGEQDEFIHTLNPLNKDMSTLRPTLMHGFLKSASYNFNRKADAIRFFEIGNVFRSDEEGSYHAGIHEETRVLFGLSGLKQGEHWSAGKEEYTFIDLKSAVYAVLQKLNVLQHLSSKKLSETELGLYHGSELIGSLSYVSEDLTETYDLEQDAFTAEFSVNKIADLLRDKPAEGYTSIPRFPAFEFDFAVVTGRDVSAGELMDRIKDKAGKQLESIDIFDVFEGESIGESKKSTAFRLKFVDPNKTLNIKEVEPIIQRIVKALEKDYDAKLRS